mmetsp:Transcript_38478/g.114203  ORF Transcript_38478/g.114203 Transcript_38478/m.114203 type:complete len:210 (-) Transcript_38478:1816-2445(-)
MPFTITTWPPSSTRLYTRPGLTSMLLRAASALGTARPVAVPTAAVAAAAAAPEARSAGKHHRPPTRTGCHGVMTRPLPGSRTAAAPPYATTHRTLAAPPPGSATASPARSCSIAAVRPPGSATREPAPKQPPWRLLNAALKRAVETGARHCVALRPAARMDGTAAGSVSQSTFSSACTASTWALRYASTPGSLKLLHACARCAASSDGK